MNQYFRKGFGLLLVLFLLLGSTSSIANQIAKFPQELRMVRGEWKEFQFLLPVWATATVQNPTVVKVNGSTEQAVSLQLDRPLRLESHQQGSTRLTLKLFGTFPLKKLDIRVVPELKVIPGGQSIGVKLKANGVLVVGHHQVQTSQGPVTPAEKAKLQIGDYIIRANGKEIHSVQDMSSEIRKSGEAKKPIQLTIRRDKKEITTQIGPALDAKENQYRLGVYIRDSVAGVGTLTFYDPASKNYGALGHVISDVDTGQPIEIGGGKVIHSSVTSIQKGESGEPGEKRAIFFREDQVLGNINKNTPFGIFGKMDEKPDQGLQKEAVPIALREQVKEGPAKILTVVDGQKVEEFDVQITHVTRQNFPATKGLIIKVTDKRLLEKTGGIVQGMSGSPILQDGKLVGAVTHVFVNDPTSGYGTFIEWMLQDAGVINQSADALGSAFSFP